MTQLRIDEVFVFIAQDADGEGVPAFVTDIGWGPVALPLVCADKARVDSLRERARVLGQQSGKRIILARFSVREEVETIWPGGKPADA
jgi:hypothetical protein